MAICALVHARNCGDMAGDGDVPAAGEVSHRDFVTHAWADNPIKDILLRIDDFDLKNRNR